MHEAAGSERAGQEPEASGWREAAAAQGVCVPAGVHRAEAQVPEVEHSAGRPGEDHHHRHLPALDTRPHQPHDQAAPGPCWDLLEEGGGRPDPVLRGRRPGIRGADSGARQDPKGDVLPGDVRRRHGPSQHQLLNNFQSVIGEIFFTCLLSYLFVCLLILTCCNGKGFLAVFFRLQ